MTPAPTPGSTEPGTEHAPQGAANVTGESTTPQRVARVAWKARYQNPWASPPPDPARRIIAPTGMASSY